MQRWLLSSQLEVVETKLLYRASRDGFLASVFHHLCDNQGPTLTLIRNSHNFVFGGFTTVPWRTDSSFSPDPYALLFSLTHVTCHKLLKPYTDKAVFMNEEFLMIFGCGDLVVSDQCNLNTHSVSQLGQEYSAADGSGVKHLAGEVQFSVCEIEVFQVTLHGT